MMWTENRNLEDSENFINTIAYLVCENLTDYELHRLIREIARRRKLVGGGYYNTGDLVSELAREHSLEELTEKDAVTFLEHLHSSSVQQKIDTEAFYEFEVGITSEIGEWYEQSPHLTLERAAGVRRPWHQQVQEIIELNSH